MSGSIFGRALFMAVLLLLAGCAGGPGLRISNVVTLCCPGDYQRYATYQLESVDLPAFMREYVEDEFDTAFQERGMSRTDQRADLVVRLTYRHVNLDPEQQEIDPFLRLESSSPELHYIANIDISIRERIGAEVVWSGTVSRIHSVSPGEYMHSDSARSAFLETFRDLLSNYPSAVDSN